jgi:hypothetical protein
MGTIIVPNLRVSVDIAESLTRMTEILSKAEECKRNKERLPCMIDLFALILADRKHHFDTHLSFREFIGSKLRELHFSPHIYIHPFRDFLRYIHLALFFCPIQHCDCESCVWDRLLHSKEG